MKLQSYKIRYYWDSCNKRVDEDCIYDINVNFIESVSPCFEVESYKVETEKRKGWFGRVYDYEVEVFDKTFNLYDYKMSSGQRFLFDVDFDIETKQLKEKE